MNSYKKKRKSTIEIIAYSLILILIGFFVTGIILNDLNREPVQYWFNGALFEEEYLEERLEFILEYDNPDLDIEVDIYLEFDDE